VANESQDARPSLRLGTVNMDCSDAGAMAEFYGRLLGWEITYRDWDFIHMRDPQGGVGLSFQEYKDYRPPVWPETPDGQDKMVHLRHERR
jgi:catechol-2,3-dioxygenase